MSDIFFTSSKPKARKIYNCDACRFLLNAWDRSDLNLMTFSERKSYIIAKQNKFQIQIGEIYIKQPQIYDGQFVTFRGIPAINDICHKYELYSD